MSRTVWVVGGSPTTASLPECERVGDVPRRTCHAGETLPRLSLRSRGGRWAVATERSPKLRSIRPVRALVTGAAGFIGSHLCRSLVADGHEVVALDDLSESTLDRLRGTPEVRFVGASIMDAQDVDDAARGCDVIFHQAGKRSVARSMADPATFVDVNVRGT